MSELPCGLLQTRPRSRGFLYVPTAIRKLWRAQKDQQYRDIYELEAIAPLLILKRWGATHMTNTLWTHFGFPHSWLEQRLLWRFASSVELGSYALSTVLPPGLRGCSPLRTPSMAYRSAVEQVHGSRSSISKFLMSFWTCLRSKVSSNLVSSGSHDDRLLALLLFLG